MLANKKNLLHGNPETQFKSGRNAVENGRKGGVSSGKSKREKKAFRELAAEVLSLENKNEEIVAIAQSFGIEKPDNKTLVVLGLTRAAICGNHNAFDRLMELVGEKEEVANNDIMSKLDAVIGEVDKLAK